MKRVATNVKVIELRGSGHWLMEESQGGGLQSSQKSSASINCLESLGPGATALQPSSIDPFLHLPGLHVESFRQCVPGKPPVATNYWLTF